jgi:hypothetical protein
MRLVKVSAPEGRGPAVAEIAFGVGVARVTTRQERSVSRDDAMNEDVVDLQVATPVAKAFIDALTSQPWFDRHRYSIVVREPVAILSHESERELTRPVTIPAIDIVEQLWQFSHVTYSFAIRTAIAAALLAYGMIEGKLLFMAAGLMFLPMLPTLLSVAMGTVTRDWPLVRHGAFAFARAAAIVAASAAAVAALSSSTMDYDDFASLAAGAVLSLIVGIAGAIGSGDDSGRRELIGLAAASQVALVPAWLGISLVSGFDEPAGGVLRERLLGFALNAAALVAAAAGAYALVRSRGRRS